ncbi:MAG: hypothetical protein AABW54_02130 [Candidatus Micrarchaeota archaeon]
MTESVWLRKSLCCGAAVKAAIFEIPAAAAYGVTTPYICAKCGKMCNPIEIKARATNKVERKKRGG